MLYRVETSFAVFAVITDDSPATSHVVVKAAPISHWAVGKHITNVLRWWKRKYGASVMRQRPDGTWEVLG